jgi:triosephosphate isomerase
MRIPLVAGNWKMNGSLSNSKELISGILEGLDRIPNAEVIVCPPFVYLTEVASWLTGRSVGLGAQNCSTEKAGAFTGEVSVSMLADVACRYVIVGHSERRTLYKEDDSTVAGKFVAVRAAGLQPILCIGEQLEEREAGITEAVIARQLDAVMDAGGVAALRDGIIAYEPIWAIGTGRTASPQQAQDVHAFIRARIAARDPETAEKIRILYGGSVKGSNAAELFAMTDIDGGLIGGASLDAREFLSICMAA